VKRRKSRFLTQPQTVVKAAQTAFRCTRQCLKLRKSRFDAHVGSL